MEFMLSTAKIQGSVDREIRSLSSTIDASATTLAATYPEAGLIIRKMPGRYVFQSKEYGISLSFFRSRNGMGVEAEAVLRVWRGEITLPGCVPRPGHGAIQVSAQAFQITPLGNKSWLWTDEAANTLTSGALATLCMETIAARLAPPDTPSSLSR